MNMKKIIIGYRRLQEPVEPDREKSAGKGIIKYSESQVRTSFLPSLIQYHYPGIVLHR
jgi:hypothetical protein